MPRFRYKGFDAAGGRLEGVVEAEALAEARDRLQASGVLVSEVAAERVENDWRSALGLPVPQVGLAELELVTSELSLLLENGVRIDRALAVLRRNATRGPVSRLLDGLVGTLKQGGQLSDAAAAQPRVFDPLYVALLRLGEASGQLPEVFASLSADLGFRRDLRQKIVSAAAYPAVIVVVCLLALLFVFNYIVPSLTGLFADVDVLPWYTSLLLKTSAFMERYQWWVGLAVLGGALLAWRLRDQPDFRDGWQRLAVNLPVLRDAVTSIERIRFASGMGMMLSAGLPVDRALRLCLQTVRNLTLRREVAVVAEKLRQGEQLSVALARTRLFPPMYISLLEAGEESGALGKVFGEIAHRSRQGFAAWTQRLTTLLEPLMIVLMGMIVGAVVVVIMLSITSLADLGF